MRLPVLAAFLVACGSSTVTPAPPADPDAGPECASGTTQGCTCPNGASGSRTCTEGRFEQCTCLGWNEDPPPAPDGGCTLGRYYVDADGDGFGAGLQVDVCEPAGAGYSTSPGDCDDADALAFPGQSAPQEGLRKGVGGGDFNCDGKEVRSWSTTTACNPTRAGCTWSGNQGWSGEAAGCGVTGVWISQCSSPGGAFMCDRDTEERPQRCL